MAGNNDRFIIISLLFTHFPALNILINIMNQDHIANEESSLADGLFKRMREFGIAYFELTKLKAADRLSDIVSSFLPGTVISIMGIIFLLFLNLGLALWLGELLGRAWSGFLIVAGIYLFFGLVIHLFLRRPIKRAAADFIIKQMFR